jgi:hypothetical protein
MKRSRRGRGRGWAWAWAWALAPWGFLFAKRKLVTGWCPAVEFIVLVFRVEAVDLKGFKCFANRHFLVFGVDEERAKKTRIEILKNSLDILSKFG